MRKLIFGMILLSFSCFAGAQAFSPGIIGNAQSICYGSAPLRLIFTTPPSGGTTPYTYRWQRSNDGSTWNNIAGATAAAATFSPPVLGRTAWFRCTVTDAVLTSDFTNEVRMFVYPNLNAGVIGDTQIVLTGTSPEPLIQLQAPSGGSGSNYTYQWQSSSNGLSWSNIQDATSSGYTPPALTADAWYRRFVTEASCGTTGSSSVKITVTETSSKAIVITNSASEFYWHFSDYIKPYLDNFGIPYDEYNVNSMPYPTSELLIRYSVVIFGHQNVFSTGNYPITALETALNTGVGLYSFDPYLFDDPNPFIDSEFTPPAQQTANLLYIDPSHYITQKHINSTYEPENSTIHLRSTLTVSQNTSLSGASNLVVVSTDGYTFANILQASTFSNGRIIKWSDYNWIFESILGPVYGMDDLIWRGIVWAARKPFVMQGMPPMFTMRVDDVYGDDGDNEVTSVTDNFQWINICNTYNIIPWCGLFTDNLDQDHIDLLHAYLFDNKATASPHAKDPNGFYGWIYFDYSGEGYVDPSVNTEAAKVFMDTHFPGHTSKYLVAHSYAIASEALPGIQDMGIEYITTPILPDNTRFASWLNLGPYRINRNGINWPEDPERPFYYEGSVSWPFEGTYYDFFICGTEIRDVDGYDWWPSNNVYNSVQSAVRQLRRGLNSMVLPTLFTHEYSFGLYQPITPANWNTIFQEITNTINGEYPDVQYLTMDDALQYVRAKHNTKIKNVTDDVNNIYISYSGNNDMNTRCYLFTETGGVISYRFLTLTQISANHNSVLSFPK